MKFVAFFILSIFFAIDLSAEIYPYETPVAKYLKPIELAEQKSGLDLIDCIYVINLDDRPQKWDRVRDLFAERGLQANRVSGINGWKLPQEVGKELAGPYPVRIIGGHLGCLLSHISILKDAYDRDFDCIWVCEDDIEFREDINQIPALLRTLDQIDPDWDIFYTDIDSKNNQGKYVPSLGSDFRPDQQNQSLSYYTERAIINTDIMKIRQRFGMYSFILSRKGIKKILDYFTHVYLWAHIDIDIHYIPNIRQYSSTRDIISVWTTSGISDTSSNIMKKID